jgi:hypothetical protein
MSRNQSKPSTSTDRMGIAPRFPDLKKYLKSYGLGWKNWQSEELPNLQRYGKEGAAFYNFRMAGSDLERVAMSLRWHAIQAACTQGAPKTKPPPSGLKACIRKYEQLRARVKAPHIYISYGDDAETRDRKIARHLLVTGFTAQEMEQTILASPRVAGMSEKRAKAYAATIAGDTAKDPEVIEFLRQAVVAREDLKSFGESVEIDWQTVWQTVWQRSVAYYYWACHIKTITQQGVWDRLMATIANSLILGWHDYALSLSRRTRWAFEHQGFSMHRVPHQRTQYFVLRLINDWQGWAEQKYPKQAYDEPLFNSLLEQWRAPNAADIAPLLLAACDRHTHESKHFSGKSSPDIASESMWYDPFEIHTVLYLRRLAGLENPALDHPLMTTALGPLPAAAPVYTDALLEAVLPRVKEECPDL